jgi:hypothetical protein
MTVVTQRAEPHDGLVLARAGVAKVVAIPSQNRETTAALPGR